MIVEIIKLMLAPGLMISACSTLLLGMHGKYGMVASRLRLLNEERRKLIDKNKKNDIVPGDTLRVNNITMQLEKLAFRIRLLRNAVVSYTSAIAVFIISSLLIGLNLVYKNELLNDLILYVFLTGVITTLTGMLISTYELLKAYDVVKHELESTGNIMQDSF